MKLKHILIVILAVVLLCAAAFGIYHIPRNTEITMNAMLVNHDGGDAKMTKLTFSGKMTHYLFGDQKMVFNGDVIVYGDSFSGKFSSYHQTIRFSEPEEGKLLGSGEYVAPEGTVNVHYTANGDLSKIVMQVVGFDGGKDCYVVAPAGTWSQINNVFTEVGVTNPFVDDQYVLLP